MIELMNKKIPAVALMLNRVCLVPTESHRQDGGWSWLGEKRTFGSSHREQELHSVGTPMAPNSSL